VLHNLAAAGEAEKRVVPDQTDIGKNLEENAMFKSFIGSYRN